MSIRIARPTKKALEKERLRRQKQAEKDAIKDKISEAGGRGVVMDKSEAVEAIKRDEVAAEKQKEDVVVAEEARGTGILEPESRPTGRPKEWPKAKDVLVQYTSRTHIIFKMKDHKKICIAKSI